MSASPQLLHPVCCHFFTGVSQPWLLLAILTLAVLVQNHSNFSRNSLLMYLTASISVRRVSFTLHLLSKEPYCLDLAHLVTDLGVVGEAQKQIEYHGRVKLEMK